MFVKGILFVMIIALVGAWLYLGWSGWAVRGTVGQSYCAQNYTHYLITPVLKNWWECRSKTPCGTDENLDRYNAKVRVIQCLCRNLSTNIGPILQFYKYDFSLEPLFTGPSQTTDAAICSAGLQEKARL